MRVSQEREEEKYKRKGRATLFGMIMGLGFTLGCILVMLCRQTILQDIALLDVDSLYLVRDSVIAGHAYFFYLLPRRGFVFLVLALLWWYGAGGIGLKLTAFLMGAEAGIWLQACLEQYYLKGILLWIFLYIPYVFFYIAAVWLGLTICEADTDRPKRRRLLKEKPWLFAAVAVLFLIGLYLESEVHPVWLKSFLKVF